MARTYLGYTQDEYAADLDQYRELAINVKSAPFGAVGDGVTDDTVAIQRAVDAAPEGSRLAFPPGGRYAVTSVDLGSKQLTLSGYGATIIQTAKEVAFDWMGTWGTSNAISSFALNGTTNLVSVLTLNAAPVDLAIGDAVKVYSDDVIPQSLFASRKKGEFAVIADIAGNDVYLTGVLRDTYTTTPRMARLDQKTVRFEGFAFEIAPAIDTGNGSSTGLDAPIRIVGAVRPVVSDVTLTRTVSNGIVFVSCLGYLAENIRTADLPNDTAANRFGYGVVDAQSEQGLVRGALFERNRHGFTTNTYTYNTEPYSYGRSAYGTVESSVGFAGDTNPFDTHDEAYAMRFVNCTAKGINRLSGTTPGTRAGFSNRGDATEILNCRVEDCARAVRSFSSDGRQGGDTPDNWNQNLWIRGLTTTRVWSEPLTIARTVNAEMTGSSVEDSEQSVGTCLASLVDASLTIRSSTLRFLNGSAAFLGAVKVEGLIAASTLRITDSTVDLSSVTLNGSSQVVNYNARIARIEDAGAHRVVLRGVEVVANSKPLAGLVTMTPTDPGDRNAVGFATDVTVFADSGNITCADTVNRQCGLTTTAALFRDWPYAQSVSRGVVQYEDGVPVSDVTSGYASYTGTETDLSALLEFQGKADALLLDYTPDGNVTLGALPDGYVRGQRLTIRHAGSGDTLTVPDGANTIIEGGDAVLATEESVTLVWNGADWVGPC